MTESPPAAGTATKHLVAAVVVALSVLFMTLAIGGDLRPVARSSTMWRRGPLPAIPGLDAVDGPWESSTPGHHAIIVPYRDREYHLARFKEYMGPYLQRNFPNDTFTLWVVEQGDGRLARGWATWASPRPCGRKIARSASSSTTWT
jgi:hypothetical protein